MILSNPLARFGHSAALVFSLFLACARGPLGVPLLLVSFLLLFDFDFWLISFASFIFDFSSLAS